MLTSSNGNIFRVTGHLCGKFTGPRWISSHNGQWRGALMFPSNYAWINDWVNNREAGDLRRQHGHYDVIVMHYSICQDQLINNIYFMISVFVNTIYRVYRSIHFHQKSIMTTTIRIQNITHQVSVTDVNNKSLSPAAVYMNIWLTIHPHFVDLLIGQ